MTELIARQMNVLKVTVFSMCGSNIIALFQCFQTAPTGGIKFYLTTILDYGSKPYLLFTSLYYMSQDIIFLLICIYVVISFC